MSFDRLLGTLKGDEMKLFENYVVGYRIADVDDTAGTKYYGYTGKGGVWYIIKEDTTEKSYRYCSGLTDYATNWTGRSALTYVYFHQSI